MKKIEYHKIDNDLIIWIKDDMDYHVKYKEDKSK
jgi:hypothetical protein